MPSKKSNCVDCNSLCSPGHLRCRNCSDLHKKKRARRFCVDCDKEISRRAKRCTSCSNKYNGNGVKRNYCVDCGKVERIVPFSCKSRFCSSCGKVAVDNWINNACNWFIDAPYHHLTFTIPEELRDVFLYDRSLYNILFKAASKTVLEWCEDTGGYVPGIACILHTFGSALNHNPHIHMMITGGGLSADGKDKWVSNEFIPWSMLKSRWKYNLITLLKPKLKRLIQKRRVGAEYLKLGTGQLFHSFL